MLVDKFARGICAIALWACSLSFWSMRSTTLRILRMSQLLVTATHCLFYDRVLGVSTCVGGYRCTVYPPFCASCSSPKSMVGIASCVGRTGNLCAFVSLCKLAVNLHVSGRPFAATALRFKLDRIWMG